MKQVVIGTAGHIDHGKTALVKALTGVNTDRLPEEKARGMTIDLGFAFLTDNITIIDVPGHERFVRNMVAGVSTVDIALITIAADDGIMPQTREHIDILHLLGVELGCIVITKIDLIEDSEWIDLLEEDIREYLKESPFENLPILRVSSENGDGVEDVRLVLMDLAKRTVEKEDRGFFRLFVDRVFSMKGFGTVVTGTVVSGSLNEGDEIEILPRGGVAKVRGLQSHGKHVESIHLGDRAALNLTNVDKSLLSRGFELVSEGFIKPTQTIGSEISLLSRTERVIRHEQRVRVHVGTDEVIGKVLLTHPVQKVLNPGETSAVLIKLEKETSVAMEDPFILRFYSPPETIGGGVIIDPHPPKQWKVNKKWLNSLVGLSQQERLKYFFISRAKKPLTLKEWDKKWQVTSPVFRRLLSGIETIEFGSIDNPIITLRSLVENQKLIYIKAVENFHTQSPYKKGISKDNLRQSLDFSISLFNFLTPKLEGEGRISVTDGKVQRSGFTIELNKKDQEMVNRVEDAIKKARFTPPSLSELVKKFNLSIPQLMQMMFILKDQGKSVEIERELWYHVDHINALERELRKFFKTNSSMGVSDFKSLTNTTRKHAIPLLEHFDKRQITKRDGNLRILVS